jgi:hypothetical protein
VKKDPPRTPPEINYEPKREMIGVVGEDYNDKDEDDTTIADSELQVRRRVQIGGDSEVQKIVFEKNHKENFYWDHFCGSFLPKAEGVDYYFDESQQIWKAFVGVARRKPYDYYFHDNGKD